MFRRPVTALRVTTAAEAAARDHAAIHAGVPSFNLMAQAGSTAAALVLRDYADRLAYGVAVYAGSGNNGGDAYIVAAQLARAGVAVRVHATAPPRTADATRALALAQSALVHGAPTGHERLVVDGLLGTGHQGPLREPVRTACARIGLARDGGATIVALDLPSGLEADSGAIADGSVPAHVTACFGTFKRGVLLARPHAGRIVLLDIGLDGAAALDDQAWILPDYADGAPWFAAMAWDAHKGRRGRVAIVGGHAGMAGAVSLAAQAALHAGAGLVHAVVDAPSVAAVQAAVPQALAEAWPTPDAHRGDGADIGADDGPEAMDTLARCDALALGPGLGRGARSAALLERVMTAHRDRDCALVLDADALWLIADVAQSLGTDPAAVMRHWTRSARSVVCTPHPGEFAQLLGRAVPAAWDERAAALQAFAVRSGAIVLLKGTPTLIATPDGAPLQVAPYGTPLLATGGSGDLLTGVIVALLGQGLAPATAAAAGAAAHGRAAELATARLGGVLGGTLDAVLQAFPEAWHGLAHGGARAPGVLAELPSPLCIVARFA